MKKLYEYVVLYHKYDEKGNFVDSEIIVEKNSILAKSERDVAFKVTRLVPEDFAGDPDNVQILIRNF